MKEENELLQYIYQTTEMGKKSLENLLEALKEKDNKIKKDIENQLHQYEEYYEKSEKLLKENNITPKSNGPMTEMMNKMGINITVIKDNSDTKIAEMLIQGLTMGTIEMEKKIDTYKEEVNKNIIKLAKEVLKFQEKNIKEMKEYL